MATYIKQTEENLEQFRETTIKEFAEYMAKLDTNLQNYINGVHFNKTYAFENIKINPENRPKIFITSKAYSKMLQYTLQSTLEIAWHGTVTNPHENEYVVTDVMLYPQTVSAATVTTDQAKYNAWLDSLDDDVFNQIRFQGHSHVNMGTTPSTTDTTYYKDLIKTLNRAEYYIFLIMNKRQEFYTEIYDLKNNLHYTNTEIDLIILDENGEQILNDVEIDIKNCIETQTIKTYYNVKYNYANNLKCTPTTYGKNQTKNYAKEGAFDDFYDDLEEKFNKKGKIL